MTSFNPEYIQSGDGNLAEPVHVGRQGQQVIFSNINPSESYTAKYPTIESVPDDFNGTVDIVTPTYRATVKGDGTNKFITGFSSTDANRPSADVLGDGVWSVAGKSYTSKFGNWVPTQTAPRLTPLRVATFGDSTSQYNEWTIPANQNTELFDVAFPASGPTLASIDPTRNSLPTYYPQAFLALNCGIGGQTTTQMLARDSAAASITRRSITDISNANIDVVLFRGGSINDLSGTMSAADVTAVYDRHIKLLNRLISTGCTIIDEGIAGYQYNPATTAFIANEQSYLVDLNTRYAAYIASLNNPKVFFLSYNGIVSDSTGAFIDTTVTLDGTHLSQKGQRLVNIAEAELLTAIFGESRVMYPGINLSSNSMMDTVTTETYGTLATGYSFPTVDSNFSLANAKVETIDGKLYQTVEFTHLTGVLKTAYINAPIDVTTMNITSGDKFGFEFDYFLHKLDGTNLPAGATIGCVFSITKTGFGRIEAHVNYETTIPAGLSEWKGHATFNPIKINEAGAALSAPLLRITYLPLAADCIPANAFKLGIGGVRVVKLP